MNQEIRLCYKVEKEGSSSMREEESNRGESYVEYDNLHELIDLLLDGDEEFGAEAFIKAYRSYQKAIKEGKLIVLTEGEEGGAGNV